MSLLVSVDNSLYTFEAQIHKKQKDNDNVAKLITVGWERCQELPSERGRAEAENVRSLFSEIFCKYKCSVLCLNVSD